jgi:hypothetical protein
MIRHRSRTRKKKDNNDKARRCVCLNGTCKNRAKYNFFFKDQPIKYFCWEHYKLLESLIKNKDTSSSNEDY